MLLPQKSDIDRSKILERRADIEQGKAITGNLDKLRQIWAEESATIEKARKAQLAAIQEEVAAAARRRDDAIKAAEAAEESIKEPMQRLDQREKPITETAAAVVQREVMLDNRSKDLDNREKDIAERDFASLEAHNQATGALASAQQQLDAAKERSERLDSTVTERIQAADKYNAEAMDLLREAKRKNEASDSRKKALDAQAEAQMREQQRLTNLERAIIDREETLQRELGRQVKKIIH